jgi:hypothetical protein
MSPPRTWRILPESHRIARESIEAISGLRQAPSLSVERSEVIGVVLIPMGDRQSNSDDRGGADRL